MTSWLSSWIPPGWITVGIAMVLMALTLAYLSSGALAQLRTLTGKRLPEGRPFKRYSEATIRELFEITGERVGNPHNPIRVLYRQALRFDLLFAFAFGLGLILILDGTLGVVWKFPFAASWLILAIPAAAALTDLLEDWLLLQAIRGSAVDPRLIRRANKATMAKWVFVTFSLLLIVVGAVALAIKGAPIPVSLTSMP